MQTTALAAPLKITFSVLLIVIVASTLKLDLLSPKELYPVWFGAGEVLHKRNPYRAEVTEQNQIAVYGRKLTDFEVSHGRDQHRFAYPAYAAFPLAPLTLLSFDHAARASAVLFAAFVAVSIFVWFRVIGWLPPPLVAALLTAVVVFSPITLRGLHQVALPVFFLLTTAAFAVFRKRLFLAGILLATATIKLQLALLPVLWLLVWSLSRFRQRQRLLFGFSLTMALLVGGSLLLVPDWLQHFAQGMYAYRGYTGVPSAFDAVFGRTVSIVPTTIVAVALAVSMWKARTAEPDASWYVWTLCLSLLATAWAVPANFDPYNQLLSLPIVFFAGRMRSERQRSNRSNRTTMPGGDPAFERFSSRGT